MRRNTEVKERVCKVLKEAGALLPKEIIERVCVEGSSIQSKQVHNFLGNGMKSGMLCRNIEGKYSMALQAMESDSKKLVYDMFKEEIVKICRKYSVEIENPFEKYEEDNLISAKKTYETIKKIKKVL